MATTLVAVQRDADGTMVAVYAVPSGTITPVSSERFTVRLACHGCGYRTTASGSAPVDVAMPNLRAVADDVDRRVKAGKSPATDQADPWSGPYPETAEVVVDLHQVSPPSLQLSRRKRGA